MKNKRIEIPLWWKCNERCFFCSETELIEYHKWKSLSFEYFYKLLISYYKEGYNHLTIVWWEPTIEKNFMKAIKLAKKLWMWVQISTNWLRFEDEVFSKEAMKYIDRITLSVHTIEDDLFKKITQTNIDWWKSRLEKILKNIWKYKDNHEIRINYVLTNYNIEHLKILDTINYIEKNLPNYTSFVLTYPDITVIESGELTKKIKVKKDDLFSSLEILYEKLSSDQTRKLVLADMPFCFVPEELHGNLQDNFMALDSISKIFIKDEKKKHDRNKVDPRWRFKANQCNNCKYSHTCFWFPNIFEF